MQDVRFADDQAMVANTERGLQRIMDETNRVSKSYGMRINIKKTKVMKIGRTPSNMQIILDGEVIQQVEEFKYLGSLISANGYSEKDIRVRIAMAKTTFSKLKTVLTGGLKQELKKRLVKTLVWSVIMYGSETWTLKKTDVSRLEAFEMWVWRKMENVKWTDKMTNVDVLKLVNETQQLVPEIRRRKRRWIGHILRHESLLQTVLEGRMEGKRPRGRKRIMMLDDIKDGRNYEKMKRRAEDREDWRKDVMRDLPPRQITLD